MDFLSSSPRVANSSRKERFSAWTFFLVSIVFLHLLIIPSSAQAQVNLTSGLVAHYPFNGNANDASGNLHHAVVNGGALPGTDRFGNANSAYTLDGVNDYLSVSDADGAFSSPSFSLSIWFYTERDDRLQMAVAKRAFDASNVSEFGLNIQAGPSVRTFIVKNNRPCADAVGNSDYLSTTVPYVTFCRFKWYHVVVTFSNGVEKIYVDGQLLSTANASFLERSDCRSQLRFGVWWSGDPNWFQGKLDDIRWYNRAINQAEVSALNNLPLAAPAQPNCPTCVVPQGTLSPVSTCPGVEVGIPFTATVGVPPFTVTLSSASGTVTQSVPAMTGNILVAPTAATTYTVTSIKDASGCERTSGFSTASVTVSMLPMNQCQPSAPSFTAPDTVCVNTPVSITNTSTNASTYLWNFCVANSSTAPAGTNLGNLGFNTPVFMDYVKEGSNYYGFVTNNSPASVVRLSYGNSLLNTPTATNLGTFGGIIPDQTEGIQLVFSNNRWYAIIVGGSNAASRIVRLDFGSSLTNTPTATNWGNIGSLAYPTDLHVFQSGNNWYGLTLNAQSSTITRFDFGSGFAGTPVGTNLGNIGGLNFPTGIYAVANGGSWYAFVSNAGSAGSGSGTASLTRLEFGNSLLNTPTGINLGNPGGRLSSVRDITIYSSCSEIVGYAVNYSASNDIVQLDFRNSITNVPIVTSIGNLGSLSFPHSISKLFRAGSDLYSFIMNVNSNSMTRLRFTGCSNSSIANSSLHTPPPFSYNSPGIYSVNLTTDEGLPTQASACKQIVVVSGQTRSFTRNYCMGDSVQLQSPLGTGNTWSTGSTASAIFATAPGTYWVRYTNGACISTDTFLVTEKPRPAISLSGGATICAGDSAQLAATGGTQYQWTPATTLSNAGVANPKAGPATNTSYQVVVTGANGCKDSGTVQVFVNAKPTAAIASLTPSICRNDSAQLVATGGGTYSWSPAAGLSSTTIANPKASPAANTVYKVVVTNSSGCKDSATVTLVVHALPIVDVSPLAPSFCPGDSVPITAAGGATYQWTPAAGLSSTSVANPWASPAATTTYQVLVTSAQGCSSTGSVTVTRKNTPSMTVSAAASICAGDSAQLQAAGGTSYLWSPAATLNNAAIAAPKAGPQASSSYQVVVTNSDGCKDSATVAITVLAKPVISILPANASTCRGDSLQLQATGGAAYQWSPATGLSATNLPNPKAAPANNTQYQLLVTGANGCKDSTLYNLTVRPKPVINLTPSTSICQGDSLQLNAQGGGSYNWSPGSGLSSTSSANPKAGPAISTDYEVIVTNIQGCTDSANVTLTVQPRPIVTITPASAICQGDSLQLQAAGGAGYNWSPTATLSNSLIANPKAGPQNNTTYQVVVTGANGCRDSARVAVDVLAKPVITHTAASSICRVDSIQLSANGGASYQWTPAVGLSNPSIPAPKAAPLNSTTYQVLVTASNGCKDSGFLLLTVNAKPVAVATPNSRLCLGDTLQLNGSGGGTYQWLPATSLIGAATAAPRAFPQDSTRYTLIVTNAAGCIDSTHTRVDVFRLPRVFQRSDTLLCPGQQFTADAATLPGSSSWQWHNGATTPTFLVDTPGVYWVNAQVTGCYHPIRDSIVVDTLGVPAVSLGPDHDICSYDNFSLRFQGRNIDAFVWSTGSTDSSIRITTTGIYRVDVSNTCGLAHDEATITVIPCNDDIYFPTAFTPNGDGKNDLFKAAHLPGVTVSSYELWVYNRWGEPVFHSTRLDEGWDGLWKGKQQDSNVFVWFARYRKNPADTERFQKGTFILIR